MKNPDNPMPRSSAGLPLPELAGRDEEMAAITETLEALEAGSSPAANISLIGPCGNGKTALLNWVKAQAGRYRGKVECVELNPKCFESHHNLVKALAGPGAFSDLDADGSSERKNLLRPFLKQRCSRNGLAVLIDEAHMLDRFPNVARSFFHDTQVLAGNGCPLLLILAGNPNIWTRLSALETTFLDRMDQIGIGLLKVAAAREALRIPLERMGYRISTDILHRAADDAQCYPYFVHVVGEALHRAAKDKPNKLGSGNEIGGTLYAEALKEFNAAMNNYYEDRYQELRLAGILPAAEAVAQLIASHGEELISTAAFEVAVERSIDGKMKKLAKRGGWIEPAAWVESELRDASFVWSRIGREEFCEPGIPGLMNYVVARAGEQESGPGRIRASARLEPASG